jgi:hypothetical protein
VFNPAVKVIFYFVVKSLHYTNSAEELKKILEGRNWDLIYPNGSRTTLKSFRLEKQFGKDIFMFSDGTFSAVWLLESFELQDKKVVLQVSRNFGRERLILSLIPRQLQPSLETKVWKIAEFFAKKTDTRIERLKFDSDTQKVAQVVLESYKEKQVLLIGLGETVEKLLAKAVFAKRKWPTRQICIAVLKQAEKLQILHSLLRNYWKNAISIYKVSTDFQIEQLTLLKGIAEKTPKIHFAKVERIESVVCDLIELDKENIEILPLKGRKLLCFLGLPFAFVKAGKVWFGIEKNKKLLTQENFAELCNLIEMLKEYRCFDSPNKQHEFYRLMPEKWLETILRRNIKLLDPELILSPVYDQLNFDKERVDLLAIRQDGRLVVIELKTSESYEMVFQALNYWWKIESARRSGLLQKAGIFPDLEIQEQPPIIYLVAPALSFHKDLDFLASTINPEIEIFRLSLNTNWRQEIKVVERRKI